MKRMIVFGIQMTKNARARESAKNFQEKPLSVTRKCPGFHDVTPENGLIIMILSPKQGGRNCISCIPPQKVGRWWDETVTLYTIPRVDGT